MKLIRRELLTHISTPVCAGMILLLAVGSYLYFLNQAVVSVVQFKGHQQDVAALQTRIASLETSLIDAQHTIAAEVTTVAGFTTDIDKIYVARPSQSLVVQAR